MDHIRVEAAFWADQQQTLMALRQRVFIQEQNVPAELEWDHADASALHWLITLDGEPVGCARLVIDARHPGIAVLGRVAILPAHRRVGLGSRLLHDIVTQAPSRLHHHGYHCQQLKADVQCSALAFYLHNNWYIPAAHESPRIPPEFHWDANIPHVPMVYDLIHHELAEDNNVTQRLTLGQDSHHYQWRSDPDNIIAIGFLQSLLAQEPRQVLISTCDIRAPLWRHDTTRTLLLHYLKASRHHSVVLLLKEEYPGLQEHPLVQLSQRISRLSIRRNVDIHSHHQLLAIPCGYLEWDQQSGNTCLNHRRECERRQRQFEEIRETSLALQEGRRVHL